MTKKEHEEMLKEFNEVVKPVIKWLNEKWHPHVKVIIEPMNAELLVGEMTTGEVTEFLID